MIRRILRFGLGILGITSALVGWALLWYAMQTVGAYDLTNASAIQITQVYAVATMRGEMAVAWLLVALCFAAAAQFVRAN